MVTSLFDAVRHASRMVSTISSFVSARPAMMPDFVSTG